MDIVVDKTVIRNVVGFRGVGSYTWSKARRIRRISIVVYVYCKKILLFQILLLMKQHDGWFCILPGCLHWVVESSTGLKMRKGGKTPRFCFLLVRPQGMQHRGRHAALYCLHGVVKILLNTWQRNPKSASPVPLFLPLFSPAHARCHAGRGG